MIKLLLVDDSYIVRKALKDLLSMQGDIAVVGECEDGGQVFSFLLENDIDVIIMDVNMKIIDGIEATRLITERYPAVKVIGFSTNKDGDKMVKNGAFSYLSKIDHTFSELVEEIRKCYRDI